MLTTGMSSSEKTPPSNRGWIPHARVKPSIDTLSSTPMRRILILDLHCCWRRCHSLHSHSKPRHSKRMATQPGGRGDAIPGEEVASTTVPSISPGTPSKHNACTPSFIVPMSPQSLTCTQLQPSCLQRRRSPSPRSCPIPIRQPQTPPAAPPFSGVMA